MIKSGIKEEATHTYKSKKSVSSKLINSYIITTFDMLKFVDVESGAMIH